MTHQPIELVAWEKLADFIVDILGWDKKGDIERIKGEVPPKSEVWQRYVSKDGKKSLEVNIFEKKPIYQIVNNALEHKPELYTDNQLKLFD